MKRPEILDAIEAIDTHRRIALGGNLGDISMSTREAYATSPLYSEGTEYNIRALLGSTIVLDPSAKYVPEALERAKRQVRRQVAYYLYKEVIAELREIQRDLYDDYSETAFRTLERIDKMIQELHV